MVHWSTRFIEEKIRILIKFSDRKDGAQAYQKRSYVFDFLKFMLFAVILKHFMHS